MKYIIIKYKIGIGIYHIPIPLFRKTIIRDSFAGGYETGVQKVIYGYKKPYMDTKNHIC
jgi:hypothetical protein